MTTSSKYLNKSGRAFTLIELLVVVAIISLLVSILIPSLTKARDLARTTLCMSNMRSVGVGLRFYLDDHKQELPIFTQDYKNYNWHTRLSEYLGYEFNKDGVAVLHCPADDRPSVWSSIQELPTMAMNAYLNKDWRSWDKTSFDDIRTPEQKVFVSESIVVASVTLPARVINPSPGSYYSSHTLANLHGQSGYESAMATYYGQGDSNNTLFVDLHVELRHIDTMPDMTIAPQIWYPWEN